MEELALTVGGILVVIAAAVGGFVGLQREACIAKWPAEFKPEFPSLVIGCTIEVNGVRIPSANYRVL